MPENILLHDGRPMVADFGIALAVSAAAGGRMTETGTSIGTPHYMSPEQATADKEITGRADIYALASVLYEMLAGEPPHTGSSAQAAIMKIIAEPVKPVTVAAALGVVRRGPGTGAARHRARAGRADGGVRSRPDPLPAPADDVRRGRAGPARTRPGRRDHELARRSPASHGGGPMRRRR